MNKILLTLTVFFSFLVSGFADTVISGTINEENKKPVPFANVVLINAADSNVVKVSITDENGKYKFEEISGGKYLVLVAQMGFEKKYSEVLEITPGLTAMNVNDISLIT